MLVQSGGLYLEYNSERSRVLHREVHGSFLTLYVERIRATSADIALLVQEGVTLYHTLFHSLARAKGARV